ncbi:hypothetical protein [Trichocoleus sp. FACHB-262]|uniref:hypothetical protein n=1 Tax=Trichocoleus sp. FACHB-262 TaxID=2692869 RepID=UPI001682C733|nr:hypothetical protein [Trichocoleus sp. FACHB-262]
MAPNPPAPFPAREGGARDATIYRITAITIEHFWRGPGGGCVPQRGFGGECPQGSVILKTVTN